MQYNHIFETWFTTITQMGPPLPTTPDINRWKTSRLEWMSPWPLTFDITRPLELQLTKKTIMYRVHKPSKPEMWQWLEAIFLPPFLFCLMTWRATQEQIIHFRKNLLLPISIYCFVSFTFKFSYIFGLQSLNHFKFF